VTWPEDSAGGSGPLEGVRILDLSRILAGPLCATILSDLGADVIKVERPGEGDETRRWGPPFAPTGDAAYFYACNRGRRAITLDLRDSVDRQLALELLSDAHVLVENFLPGALARVGLDGDTIRSRNPRLVHCTISGYGIDSSRSSWPALDFVVQAHAGLMGVTGTPQSGPLKAGVPVADVSAGLHAAIGILAALRRAEATGEGAHVEVALADAAGALLVNQAMNHLIAGIDGAPAGNVHPSLAPYETIMAADRAIALAATSEVQFQRLCATLELPQLALDPRFATNSERVANRSALLAALGERLRSRPAAAWVQALGEAGVPAAVVNSPAGMLDDPDTRARLVTEARDPAGGEPIPQLRTPIRLNGRPLEPGPAPRALGADDDAVRRALGYPARSG